VYVADATPLQDLPLVSVSKPYSLRAGYNSYVGQFYVPSGYTLIEIGYMVSPYFAQHDIESTTATRKPVSRFFSDTKEFIMSFPVKDSTGVTAYLIVEDSLGNLETYYSDHIGPSVATLYVNGIPQRSTSEVIFNGPTPTAHSYKIWVYDSNFSNIAGLMPSAATASTVIICNAQGEIRLARVWFKIGTTEYLEEISYERSKYAFTGAIPENNYYTASPIIGNIKGNLLLNAAPATTWTFAPGEFIVVFAGNGSNTATAAWWARTEIGIQLGSIVQYVPAA
jgi:hypothetical protein